MSMHVPPPEAMNCHVVKVYKLSSGELRGVLKYPSNYEGPLFLEPCRSRELYNGAGCEGCYRNCAEGSVMWHHTA